MPKLPRRYAILKPENGVALIPLGRERRHGFAVVDIEDSWLDKYWWHIDTNGYPITTTGLKRGAGNIYMHKLLCEVRDGYQVDHINRRVRDNRRHNLREATVHQNMMNKVVYRSASRTSRFKGVCYIKNMRNRKKPWQYALYSVNIPGGKIYGYVSSEVEAARKYNELAKVYQGDRAVLNKV